MSRLNVPIPPARVPECLSVALAPNMILSAEMGVHGPDPRDNYKLYSYVKCEIYILADYRIQFCACGSLLVYTTQTQLFLTPPQKRIFFLLGTGVA